MSQTQQNRVTINLARRAEPTPLQLIAVRQSDAAHMLSMCERTLAKLSAPFGPIPCIRLGTEGRNMVLYVVAALEKWAIENAERGALIPVNSNDSNDG